MVRGSGPDSIAQRTRSEAMDDQRGCKAGKTGVVEVARERLERLLDPGSTQIQGCRDGPRPLA